MDLNKYKELFISSVRESLDAVADLAVSLEKEPSNLNIVNEVFRHAHSVKGMAATMGYKNMSTLSHKLENLFDKFRKEELKIAPSTVDVILSTHSVLNNMLSRIEEKSNDEISYSKITEQIEAAMLGKEIERIKNDEISLEITVPKDPFVKVKSSFLDNIIDIISEFNSLKWRIERLDSLNEYIKLPGELEHMAKLTKDLSDRILTMRMLPLNVLCSKLPRLVRELSQKLDKSVDLEIQGESIELDKNIIESLESPIIHIIRNSIDHGIETPDERERYNKSKEGNIFFKAFRVQNRVVIEIGDDGKGIDLAKITKKAIEMGIINEMDADLMSEEKKYLLICAPGISTQKEVSEVSGRGVGMDIVKSALESLGGNLSIFSGEGMGTTFRISLPLTQAIIKVFVVSANDVPYGIPVNDIVRMEEINRNDLEKDEMGYFLNIEESINPLRVDFLARRLNREFVDSRDKINLIYVRSKDELKGLVADDLLGVKEVIIKPLSVVLKFVKEISGVTILPTGSPMFILNVEEMI